MNNDFNLNNLVRENIKAMKAYSSARDEFTDFEDDMVFLDANENPFETTVNRYPDPQQINLKTQLSSVKRVPIDQILLGNGSDEVLDLIFRAFCEPNRDNIITLPPTYGMYNVLANTNAIENKEVLLIENFQLDVDAILVEINEQTKLIFICSPNNPTGKIIASEAIETILKTFNGIVVIDEAYIDFADAESWTTRLQEFPNLIVTQTLSKAYGMAGIRLGMCFASAEIIAVLNKIKPPYNVNVLTQQVALKRVLEEDNVLQEIKTLVSERDKLMKNLAEVSIIETLYKSDANFILAKVDDANTRYKQLIEKGIVIRNRSTQPLCENTLRFTVGTKEENEKLIASLQSISKS
jgi:histidinol-phosphate aminotransferase